MNSEKKYSKKKKGFTLIELIAVMAIIVILASAILPKVNGYVKEAKKTKVIDQCRKVVMAVESYNLRNSVDLSKNENISNIVNNKGVSKYVNSEDLKNLNASTTTLQNCYDVLNGKEFEITNTELLDVNTIREIEVKKQDN